MTKPHTYIVPTKQLSLSGPVAKPDKTQLPIRGDLAHIGLANTYLVAHYVMPQLGQLTADCALHAEPDDKSEIRASYKARQTLEILDIAGTWAWACLGPEGPTGYLPCTALKP